MTLHYHVASALAGYGPDGEDIPSFETLSEALEYARDELCTYVDMAYEDAKSLAETNQYEEAWKALKQSEALELLRANLDPKRKNAPLYVNDAAAYEQLQQQQWGEFPVDVSHNSRLYVWDCSETECELEQS